MFSDVPRIILGCKVNQAEADWFISNAVQKGWAASLALVFTCSVTAAAGRQSRQAARRLIKDNPSRTVWITGCDLQASPQHYQAMAASDQVRLLPRAFLAQWTSAGPCGSYPLSNNACPPPDQHPFCPGMRAPQPEKTRALLKLQDGCDARCAYCIVPSLRGRPRSLPKQQALLQFKELVSAQAHEVVLTGIHLGRYGQDFNPPAALAELLSELLAQAHGCRIRLSSLEAGELTPELLSLLAKQPLLCPHLHLPLQSGCDQLLLNMNRTCLTAEYAQAVHSAVKAIPNVCLGADVLAGLPGEDEEAFAATMRFLETLPLAYLHVFPYSPRPGTQAYNIKGRPSVQEVRRRTASLRQLSAHKWKKYLKNQLHKELTLIMESNGWGRAENYCPIKPNLSLKPGQKVKTYITGLSNDEKFLLGKVLS